MKLNKNIANNKNYINKTAYKYKKAEIYFISLVKWIAANIVNICNYELTVFLRLVAKIFKILNSRGTRECIKYVKNLRFIIQKIIFSNYDPQLIRELKIPKILKAIVNSHDNGKATHKIRLTLSILSITRFLRLPKEPSYDSITKGPSYEGSPLELEKYVRPFLKDLGINTRFIGKPNRRIRFSKPHFSIKSGPNGLSTWYSISSLKDLPLSLFTSLHIVGGKTLSKTINCLIYLLRQSEFVTFFNTYCHTDKKEIRKLALIADKEGKTREVAMLDYWSQTALKPLHDYIFKLLSRIKQDCTHDQIKGFYELQPTPGSSFHSIDLTNATDRFPIAIQKLILTEWFGEVFSHHWENIMVGYDFKVPLDTRNVKYTVGNPMGAYSSWAVFVISHHFLVYVACKMENKNWYKLPYRLLGDDIVIADDKVAYRYKEILTRFGIEFSPAKTHISLYAFEFAKQIRFNGINISPLPLSALYSRRNSVIESCSILSDELQVKKWEINTSIFNVVSSFVRTMMRFSSKRFKRFEPKLRLTLDIVSYFRQDISDLGNSIERYVEHLYKQKLPIALRTVYINELLVLLLKADVLKQETKIDKVIRSHSDQRIYNRLFAIALSIENTTYSLSSIADAIPFFSYLSKIRLERAAAPFIKKDTITWKSNLPKKLKETYSVKILPLKASDIYKRHLDVDVVSSLRTAQALMTLVKTTNEIKNMGRIIPLPWSKGSTPKRPSIMERKRRRFGL